MIKKVTSAVIAIDREGRFPAITKSLTLAARAVARMEAAAQAVHAEANGERGFQAVSSKEGFTAVIRHGRTLIEISVRRVWCVTHSHGGNVALYALRDDQFAQRLAGIAFFGTPFLHVHRRNLQRFCFVYRVILHVFLLILGTILLFTQGFLGFLGLFDFANSEVFQDVFFIIWITASLVGATGCAEPLSKYAERKLLDFLSGKQEEIWGLLAQPSPACPTYVATVPRDEAAFVLTSIDDISVIPWIGWDVATRAVVTVIFSYIIFALYGSAG